MSGITFGGPNFQPPPDSTQPLEVSLHWLTATTKELDITDAVGFVSDYLGHGPELQDHGVMGYTSTFAWAGGLKLLDNDKRPEMGVCLSAPGDACEFHGFDKLSHIYQSLQMRASRCDIAVDNCEFTPRKLYDHWISDEVRTQARVNPNSQEGREHLRTHNWVSSTDGDTFYMGSRSSSQFARCYDSRGFTRFEVELKKERAEQVMQALCSGKDMKNVAGDVINQFVAFVHLDNEKRERCSYQPWWGDFIYSLESADVVTRLDPRPEPTVERLKDWIEFQVAPSLAVYETLFGKRDDFDDVRRDLRKIGLQNAKPHHKALIVAGGGWLSQHDEPQYLKVKLLSMLEKNNLLHHA